MPAVHSDGLAAVSLMLIDVPFGRGWPSDDRPFCRLLRLAGAGRALSAQAIGVAATHLAVGTFGCAATAAIDIGLGALR